jgi:hypothetical protein
MEAGEVDDISGGAGGGVEFTVQNPGDLQRSGDEFGAEERIVVGLVELIPAEGGEANADRLLEVIGPLFSFGELEPLLHFADISGVEGVAQGEPPDRAGFMLKPIVEPLELHPEAAIACADTGETEVNVGFGQEDGVVWAAR